MTRYLPPAFKTAIGGTFYPVVMVYIDWPDEPIYAHSNIGTITTGGNDWTGVGNLGAVEVPEEAGLVPSEASVWLIGTTAALLDAMAVSVEDLRNKDSEIFIGVTTTAGGTTLIGEPVSLFTGYFDARTFPTEISGDMVQERIKTVLGSGPSARASAKMLHSNEDQQIQQPGDTLMRHLAFSDTRQKNPATW